MDETRRVLRVILKTARTPLTVQKLTESYRNVTGLDIPLEELGYWDLFDFLSDLPELLCVKGNTLDSEVTLSQPSRPLSQKEKRPTENPNLSSLTRLSEVTDTQENCNSPENPNTDDVDENVRLTVCTFGEFMREQGHLPKEAKRKSKHKKLAKADKEKKKEEKKQKRRMNNQDDKRNVCRSPSVASRIPKYFRDKLSELIGEFSEGIWCTELPNLFKEKFGRELPFDRMGFRCLILMCMELDEIFHCRRESECDYKLYDARKPIPKLTYSEIKKAPRIVEEKEWHVPSDMYVHLFPEGAVDIDVEIPRDFVTIAEYESNRFRVVAAEIYDPSKFWLYRDDGQLEALTAAMDTFYSKNRDRFRIPKQFFEIGRYCVVVSQNQYNRCVIVKILPNASFVNVFYIDYGSLGAIKKDQIWFLTKDFVDLPAQAIRARLSDIRPPTRNAMWSSEATHRFRQLADMMHLEARIMKVSIKDKCVEVRMGKSVFTPDEDINSILVEEGYALYTHRRRKENIYDINCVPRVESIHLFPNFEEIEHWLVPSSEEKEEFYETDMTGDFHCLQYFSRPGDKDNCVQEEVKKEMEKRKKPIKYIKSSELLHMRNMREISKISYGDLYEKYEEKLNETAQGIEFINTLAIQDYLK